MNCIKLMYSTRFTDSNEETSEVLIDLTLANFDFNLQQFVFLVLSSISIFNLYS